MTESIMFVRIRPYNKRQGALRRTHVDLKSGLKFKVGQWYAIPASIAHSLRFEYQVADDPESGEVFDICDEAHARQLEEYERQKRERVTGATVDRPVKMAGFAEAAPRVAPAVAPAQTAKTAPVAVQAPQVAEAKIAPPTVSSFTFETPDFVEPASDSGYAEENAISEDEADDFEIQDAPPASLDAPSAGKRGRKRK